MRRLLFALALLCASVAEAAYTYNLTGVTQDDIEGIIYRGEVGGVFVKLLEAGDTVVLPAGSATWGDPARGNGGRIYFQNGYDGGGNPIPYTNVTFRGQNDATVITMHEGGAVYAQGVINLGATGLVFKDMKIKGAGDRPVTAILVSANGCRISNITYEGQPDSVANNGQDGTGYFVFQQGVTGTLIDHCRISAALGNHEWIFTRGPSDAWQQSTTIGTSQMDVFVEDCTFTNTGYSDANANARHVFRFNTITGNIKFDAHGVASNSPARSFRTIEYYYNTWTSAGMSSSAAMEIRGGSGMVFNNTSVTGKIYLTDYTVATVWPNSSTMGWWNGTILVTQARAGVCNVNTPIDHPFQTGMSVIIGPFESGTIPNGGYVCTRIDSRNFEIPYTLTAGSEAVSMLGLNKTPYNWPLFDQVGNGKDGAAREPMYLWGNTQGGSAWTRELKVVPGSAITTYRVQVADGAATFSERDVISPNRDFFATAGFDSSTGVSVGTRAAMDLYTPSVTGYGWWVTDEGSWNTKLPANTSGRLYKWNGSAWVLFYTPYTYPHPLQTSTECAQPEPSVAAGAYEYSQSVTLQSAPSDATIRYTTDGSTPSQSVGTVYSGAISISATTQIKAIAYKTGLANSTILDATYTITSAVFQPTISVATGSYHGTQSVSMFCATSGAEIRYTTDGSTPNGSSTLYSSPISVPVTTTIKAIGIKSGLSSSAITTSTITILLEVGGWNQTSNSFEGYGAGGRIGFVYFTAPVTGNVTQISAYSINTSATLDIEFGMYEDTSGTQAFAAMPKVTGTPATFNNVGTWEAGWKNFAVSFPVTAGHSYWIMMGLSENGAFSMTGNYLGGGGKRWFNNATFGESWASAMTYHGNNDGWQLNIKAMITETGGTVGDVATPSPSPAGGVYIQNRSVTLSCATAGASIFYTLDGSTPTSSSLVYSSPILLTLGQSGTVTRTIRAIAIKAGSNDSAVMTETYSMFVPTAGFAVTTLNVGTLNIQ